MNPLQRLRGEFQKNAKADALRRRENKKRAGTDADHGAGITRVAIEKSHSHDDGVGERERFQQTPAFPAGRVKLLDTPAAASSALRAQTMVVNNKTPQYDGNPEGGAREKKKLIPRRTLTAIK